MDSNHDNLIQSQVGYRYPTRQKRGTFGTSERGKVKCYVQRRGPCFGLRTAASSVIAETEESIRVSQIGAES